MRILGIDQFKIYNKTKEKDAGKNNSFLLLFIV